MKTAVSGTFFWFETPRNLGRIGQKMKIAFAVKGVKAKEAVRVALELDDGDLLHIISELKRFASQRATAHQEAANRLRAASCEAPQ